MSPDTNSPLTDSKRIESDLWKALGIGWWVLNGLFAVYLVSSYSGVFRVTFPQLFTIVDSEVFLRTVAIASILLAVLVRIFHRHLARLLALIEANYRRIVTSADPAAHRFVDNRSGLDTLLRLTAVLVGGLLVFYALTDHEHYGLLIREDGVVESSFSVLWFAAAIASLVSLVVGVRHGVNKTFYVLLAIFFIVCGGEEISWGQRLLELETPTLLRDINVQDETTLHNIGSISLFSNAFFLISIVFFLIVPWLQWRVPGFMLYLAHFGLLGIRRGATVVYLISLAAWIIVGLRYGTLGFHPFTLWGYYEQLDDELFELMTALSFFSFAVLDLEGRVRSR